MWSSLPLLTLLATHALAQSSGILQFGPGQLPACAQACSQLQNAQTACISVPSTEHSCFCQSAYLTQQTNLFQTPDGTCVDTCTAPADRQQIQTWFKGYCANPQQNAPAPAPAPAGGAQTSTAPAPAASTSSFAGTPVDESPPSWWSAHAKWVAMVIVLVVGFAIIIVVGIWLKRRHDRKVNRATTTPLPVGWGPNSDPHAYGGPTEKTSTSRAHEPPPASVSVMEEGRARSRNSQRLSKKNSSKRG